MHTETTDTNTITHTTNTQVDNRQKERQTNKPNHHSRLTEVCEDADNTNDKKLSAVGEMLDDTQESL